MVQGVGSMLAGQTGADEKGEYAPGNGAANSRGPATGRNPAARGGAGPEHVVRLTWYLTSRAEYAAAASDIAAAWRETLGRNFPPSTLLYVSGLVDANAKVEIEVTAFVPAG